MAQSGQHDFIHKTGSDYVLHCRQKKIEPRPHVTCTGNFVKFGRVVLRHASAQTYRHACRQYFARFSGGNVSDVWQNVYRRISRTAPFHVNAIKMLT